LAVSWGPLQDFSKGPSSSCERKRTIQVRVSWVSLGALTNSLMAPHVKRKIPTTEVIRVLWFILTSKVMAPAMVWFGFYFLLKNINMKYNNLSQFCDTENWVFFPKKGRKKILKFTL
jgi:hypothetical protein